MGLLNLSKEFVEAHPEVFKVQWRKFNQYDFPYVFC